jgi:hypothetical protein
VTFDYRQFVLYFEYGRLRCSFDAFLDFERSWT